VEWALRVEHADQRADPLAASLPVPICHHGGTRGGQGCHPLADGCLSGSYTAGLGRHGGLRPHHHVQHGHEGHLRAGKEGRDQIMGTFYFGFALY